MTKMNLIRLHKNLRLNLLPKTRCFSTVAPREEDEYTASPEYPPILDLSYEKKIERRNEALYEEIRNVKTVEEKQIKINMPRYYGFRTHTIYEDNIPYDGLTLAQHITRTHIIENKELPKYYQNVAVEDSTLKTIVKDVEEMLLMEVEGIKKHYDLKNIDLTSIERDNLASSCIVRGLNRAISSNLAQDVPHLKTSEMDLDPRLEASWVVGGMNPPPNVKKSRLGQAFFKQFADDPVDRIFTYIGSPLLTIRSNLPLQHIIPISEAENPAFEVPFCRYDPAVLGERYEYRRLVNVPGFWPGDLNTFGLISYLKTGHMRRRNEYYTDPQDAVEAAHRQAVLSSFAWLYSQANYLGFTTYNDITYPLVTQTVLTNGKDFQFYVYQLNTIIVYGKNCKENPKRNICWTTDKLRLYDEVKDGKIVGLNEEVVRDLVKLYINKPEERLGINLRPYLSQEEKLAADYEDDDKRRWLEREYKFLMSNRPRYKEVDEYYSWEKIYKIDHDTRQMDKRRRFYEFFEKPWKKRLDDKLPDYIPRALRPDLPRYKGRRGKDYYP